MIYLENKTSIQSVMIPRSEGTILMPSQDPGSGMRTTYTSAEIDAMLARIDSEKLNRDALKAENWRFKMEDGSEVEKDVAIWNSAR